MFVVLPPVQCLRSDRGFKLVGFIVVTIITLSKFVSNDGLGGGVGSGTTGTQVTLN